MKTTDEQLAEVLKTAACSLGELRQLVAEGKITVELLNDLQVTERSRYAFVMEAKR